VKYADPEYYQAFLDELLQRSTKTAINCDLSIESTSGKVCTALQHDQFPVCTARPRAPRPGELIRIGATGDGLAQGTRDAVPQTPKRAPAAWTGRVHVPARTSRQYKR